MLIIPNSPSCVFAFWNGMTYETQIHIIELCVFCPTVKTFAVFRDKVRDKWADPDEGQSFGILDQQPSALTACISCSFRYDPGAWA